MQRLRRHHFTGLLLLAVWPVHAAASDSVASGAMPSCADRFDGASLTVPQDLIRVDGNRFVDGDGQIFVFRGVSIADPARLLDDGHWNRRIFEEIVAWGGNTVRLPVHPAAWRAKGRAAYLALIDDAVRWSNELGLYVIVDWHSIGNLLAERFQRASYETTQAETIAFWDDIACRYRDVATVAVYELFNEPTDGGGRFGQGDWSAWRAFNEMLIDRIRAVDGGPIPLVAGFDWAYELRSVRDDPVERDGVAYVSHPYPQKERPVPPSRENFFAAWEEAWGYVADAHPMILTEMGWVREDGYGAHVPVINDGSYGPMIAAYMERKGVSWTAWCFDPRWSPVLIEDWDFRPSEQGVFFRNLMLNANERSNP